MKAIIRNSYPNRLRRYFQEYLQWSSRNFNAPSPHFIKHKCLVRNSLPNATWIETGTYLGQTTALLAKHGTMVYSIEPEPTLFQNAQNYFNGQSSVEIINGLSENIFPTLLPKISGSVNFWLDGHYSSGITHKGPQETPIVDELRCISDNIDRFDHICVFIDDIRCFNPKNPIYSTYPSLNDIVDWANNNALNWHIEHDIFIAKK